MSDVTDTVAMAGVVDASAKRLSSAIAEACFRAHSELVATQATTAAYVNVMLASCSALDVEATHTVDLAGQLASQVCILNDRICDLRHIAVDVESALAAVGELEDVLTRLENEP